METDRLRSLVEAIAAEQQRLESVFADMSAENDRLRASSSLSTSVPPVRLKLPLPLKLVPSGGDLQDVTQASLMAPTLCMRYDDMQSRGSSSDGSPRPSMLGHSTPSDTSDVISGRQSCSKCTFDGSAARCRSEATPTAKLFRSHATVGALPAQWPEWHPNGDETEPGFMSLPLERKSVGQLNGDSKVKSGGRLMDESGLLRRFVLHPGSNKRSAWDLMSLLVIGFDMLYIPFDLGGFSVPEAVKTLEIIEIITASFWVLDIFMSFMTGYHTAGVVEMRLRKIARKYLGGWFLFDLSVAAVDLVFIFLGTTTIVRIGKVKRFLRMIRTLRLMRSVKMSVKMSQVIAGFRSERLRILVNTLVLALSILSLNHYFACGWYYVGITSDFESNWVFRNAYDEGIGMRYATALHWSFTQFTPAGMEIHPNNLTERVYTVVTVFFAMITFSSFTGSITANMTALRRLTSEPAEQQKHLFDYFTESGISAELGARIWGYLKANHYAHRRQVMRKDIHVLRFLPPTLSCDLNEELYVPVVKHCPFFYYYGIMHYSGLCAVCDTVVSEAQLTLGERLFQTGAAADNMFFVTAGVMDYEHHDSRLSATVSHLQWVSEPVLWMKWYYCGTLSARTSCQVVLVNSKKFRSVVSEQVPVLPFVKAYVVGFRSWMIAGEANEASTWKTDVWLQTAQLRQIAMDTLSDEAEHHKTGVRLSWFRQHSISGTGSMQCQMHE